MDFYRLKQPGSEWFSRQGDVIKAARSAGVEWEKVEVPDPKAERLDWLNANARGGASSPSITAEVESEAEDVPLHRHTGKEVECPRCKWTPRMCDGFVRSKQASLTMDAVRQFIDEREGWELTGVVEAIMTRLSDLAKLVGKKPG